MQTEKPTVRRLGTIWVSPGRLEAAHPRRKYFVLKHEKRLRLINSLGNTIAEMDGHSCFFSPNGKQLVIQKTYPEATSTISRIGHFQLLDVATQEVIMEKAETTVFPLGFSEDGRYLLQEDRLNNVMILYNAQTGEYISEWVGESAWFKGSNLLAVHGVDKSFQLIDLTSNKVIFKAPKGYGDVSDDQRFLALSVDYSEVYVIELQSGRTLKQFAGDRTWFSLDSRFLGIEPTNHRGPELQIYDLEQDNLHRFPGSSFKFLDNQRVCTWGISNQKTYLIDLNTAKILCSAKGELECASPDGRWLVLSLFLVAQAEHYVIDTTTCERYFGLEGKQAQDIDIPVGWAHFSADSQMLMTESENTWHEAVIDIKTKKIISIAFPSFFNRHSIVAEEPGQLSIYGTHDLETPLPPPRPGGEVAASKQQIQLYEKPNLSASSYPLVPYGDDYIVLLGQYNQEWGYGYVASHVGWVLLDTLTFQSSEPDLPELDPERPLESLNKLTERLW